MKAPWTGRGETMEKLRRLQAVTDASLSALELEDLLAELLERTRELLTADTAAVLLLDPSGTELVVTAASGLKEKVHQDMRIPLGVGISGRVAESAEPVWIEEADGTDALNSALFNRGVVSVLGVPMFAGDLIIGVLHVGTLRRRRFSDDDIELLRLVADRASLATQARLSRLDRAAALALQRSLLPGRPRVVPGLDVAVRYVPGAEVGVGGDWYDLFALPSGHIGATIGDVAGNGLRAAVIMGRLRSALRAYALESDDPADVLTRLDRKVQLFEPGAMATAVYAVIDPDLTGITLSTAGHPPPAILGPDRAPQLVRTVADAPLGAFADAPRHNTHLSFDTGTCVFLYTDGLVERRNQPIDDGLRTLLSALIAGPADKLCAIAMATMLDDQPAPDDVALLAVRRWDA